MPEYKYPGYGPTNENWLTPRAKTKGGYHGGSDNPAKPGTPVYAQYNGEVFRTGNIDGYGMSVVIKSKAPDGTVFYQLYGHLGPDPLPAPGTPVFADQPIPGAVIGTTKYVQDQGGLTSGPHLHREIISGKAPLHSNPKEGFGIYSSDITHKADPDTFDIDRPVFPYQKGEPKPALQSRPAASQPRPSQVRPPSGGTLSTQDPRSESAARPSTSLVVPDAEGLTSIGGPNGPAPLRPPASSRSPASARPEPAGNPMLPPLQFAPEAPHGFGPLTVPGLFRSDASNATRESFAATPPAVLRGAGPIGDGNGIGDWWDGLASASSNLAPAPVRKLSSFIRGAAQSDRSPSAAPPQSAALPGVAARQPGSLAFPSVPFPLEALLEPDRALDQWASSSPRKGASPSATEASTGLPGLIASVAGRNSINPDQTPAGGLLGMIQDYMRNNGY